MCALTSLVCPCGPKWQRGFIYFVSEKIQRKQYSVLICTQFPLGSSSTYLSFAALVLFYLSSIYMQVLKDPIWRFCWDIIQERSGGSEKFPASWILSDFR